MVQLAGKDKGWATATRRRLIRTRGKAVNTVKLTRYKYIYKYTHTKYTNKKTGTTNVTVTNRDTNTEIECDNYI